jgi:hypothetical protein
MVAPTLSPMPNGRPLSDANAAAEFASSAIAFRGIDFLDPNDLARRAPQGEMAWIVSTVQSIRLEDGLPDRPGFVVQEEGSIAHIVLCSPRLGRKAQAKPSFALSCDAGHRSAPRPDILG